MKFQTRSRYNGTVTREYKNILDIFQNYTREINHVIYISFSLYSLKDDGNVELISVEVDCMNEWFEIHR